MKPDIPRETVAMLKAFAAGDEDGYEALRGPRMPAFRRLEFLDPLGAELVREAEERIDGQLTASHLVTCYLAEFFGMSRGELAELMGRWLSEPQSGV